MRKLDEKTQQQVEYIVNNIECQLEKLKGASFNNVDNCYWGKEVDLHLATLKEACRNFGEFIAENHTKLNG